MGLELQSLVAAQQVLVLGAARELRRHQPQAVQPQQRVEEPAPPLAGVVAVAACELERGHDGHLRPDLCPEGMQGRESGRVRVAVLCCGDGLGFVVVRRRVQEGGEAAQRGKHIVRAVGQCVVDGKRRQLCEALQQLLSHHRVLRRSKRRHQGLGSGLP